MKPFLQFLSPLFSFLTILTSTSNHNIEATHHSYVHRPSLPSSPSISANQVYRTGFHFQPPKNWINDPNGPMYYKGLYHLFYQYNTNGPVWVRNIVWAHSVSKDLINWERLENAIYPSKPFDAHGCWSGSATVLPGNKPAIFYTGIINQEGHQVQNIAFPANMSDPYLRAWIKPDDINPLIVPDQSINRTSFRDPTTAWKGKDGLWRLSLGGSTEDTGTAYLYISKDFIHWIKAKEPLHSVPGTGNWECPDFFPVSVSGKNGVDDTSGTVPNSVRHVLKASLAATLFDYYTIGTYENDKYTPDEGMVDGWNGLRYDYGKFYASKTFYDPYKKRRVLWGWANESDAAADDIARGWAGIQLIPRRLWLDPNGKQLLQWPVEEVDELRGKKVELRNQKLAEGKQVEIEGVTAAQADIEVIFSFDSLDKAEPFDPMWDRYDAEKLCGKKDSSVRGGVGPFGLATLASKNLEEFTPVFFRVFKDKTDHIVLMCSDASRSSLKDGNGSYRPSFAGFVNLDLSKKKLSLRSLIDNSVVESFGGGGKTCITSRVYPTLAIHKNAHLFAFNNGTETIEIDRLKAWSMNTPKHMNQ